MENLSGPEKPSVEPVLFPGERLPFQEVLSGAGIFLIALAFFFGAQSVVFVHDVWLRTAEFHDRPFGFALLQEPGFAQAMTDLAYNGDVVARASVWSGVMGALAVFGFCLIWKQRSGIGLLLGLRMPSLKATLKWVGIFILLASALEALGYFFPMFRTDFMERILASTTDRTMLILGAGLLGPLCEELLLRGVLYGAFRHAVDQHMAVALTAGVFTLMHVQYEWPVMLMILPIGVVLGYARANTGSIWVPVLLHVLNNMAGILVPGMP